MHIRMSKQGTGFRLAAFASDRRDPNCLATVDSDKLPFELSKEEVTELILGLRHKAMDVWAVRKGLQGYTSNREAS